MNTPERTSYEQIPVPRDLYAGLSSAFEEPPRNILVFYRRNAEEARDYNVRAMHHRFVLCLCIAGGVDFMVEDQVLPMRPNGALLLFPHQPHYFGPFPSEAIAWLFVSFELNNLQTIAPLRNQVLPLSPTAWTYVNHIVDAYRAGLHGDARLADDILPWTMLLLNHLLETKHAQGPVNALELLERDTNPARQRVRQVAEYVHAHLDESLSLPTVAREVGCSESLLRKLFRDQAGISIGRFIRQARIHKACQLLHTSSQSITHIAGQCGFNSPYAFCRTFRQVMGAAPLHYRKQIRE